MPSSLASSFILLALASPGIVVPSVVASSSPEMDIVETALAAWIQMQPMGLQEEEMMDENGSSVLSSYIPSEEPPGHAVVHRKHAEPAPAEPRCGHNEFKSQQLEGGAGSPSKWVEPIALAPPAKPTAHSADSSESTMGEGVRYYLTYEHHGELWTSSSALDVWEERRKV